MLSQDLAPMQKDARRSVNYSVFADTVEDAEDLFVTIKERLLGVNNWREYGGNINTNFTLTDARGKELKRHAHKHDYIRMDRPGNASEWARVETIVYDDYPDEDCESIAMHLSFTKSPMDNKHGETDDSIDNTNTSAIEVARDGATLTCWYYRCHETINLTTQSTYITDGVSDMEWSALVSGLLKNQ